MTDEDTRRFKNELFKLLRHQQIIRDYQVEVKKWEPLVSHGELLSKELIEFSRKFSLALLPEARKRLDMETANTLKKSWETAKESQAISQNSARDFVAFSKQLEADWEEVQRKKQELISTSGYSPEELEKIFDEMIDEVGSNLSKKDNH